MEIAVWQFERPKGRTPLWAYRITDGAKMIFESRTVSVRFLTEDAARWMARQVSAAHVNLAVCPRPSFVWKGDLDDDCGLSWNGMFAHAEWMHGPRRGGSWYCSICGHGPEKLRLFHTIDNLDVQPRSGAGTRWLCELIVYLADHGLLELREAT